MLNCRGAVSSPPHSPGFFDGRSGHCDSPIRSARKRALHFLQSTIGSWKFVAWPETSQTFEAIRIDVSMPTTSSRRSTIALHQSSRIRRLSAMPTGP